MNILEQIEGLVSTKLGVVKSAASLFKLEARLAGLSVFPLILNVALLIVVLLSLWLSTLFFGWYLIYLATENILASTIAIIFVNLLLILGLVKYLSFNLKCMSFEQTRAYFSKEESPDHDKLEKTSNSSN